MPSLADNMLDPSILIVDPDEARREATRRLCEAEAFRIRSAATFLEARNQIVGEPPDVLITELKLGPYNGLHLVLRSRSRHPRMGAIVTSTIFDPAQKAEVARHKAVFLVHPFTDRELRSALEECYVLSGLTISGPPGAPCKAIVTSATSVAEHRVPWAPHTRG